MNRNIALSLIAALTLSLFAGCAETGRIPLDRETQAEKESTKANPIVLREFADQVAMDMNRKIMTAPTINTNDGKATVIIGDFLNKTNTTPTQDFEMFSKRIRSDLINSFASSKLSFVERRARMSRLAEQENIGTTAKPAQPAAYNAETTYTLNGDFYRLTRGKTNLYYMEYQLVNFATNQIVFSSSTEYKSLSK